MDGAVIFVVAESEVGPIKPVHKLGATTVEVSCRDRDADKSEK